MFTRVLHRVAAHPRAYDFIQWLFGYSQLERILRPRLAGMEGLVVVDVGAGTGAAASLLPPGVRYIWLDLDTEKLRGYRAKDHVRQAALCDATRLCLDAGSADYVLCIAVAHHLTDAQLEAMLSEAARVARQGIIFWEPVEDQTSWRSRLMWRYDRGSHPRTHADLAGRLERWFDLEQVEAHTIVHRYLLCRGRVRRAS